MDFKQPERKAIVTLLAGLKSTNQAESAQAGMNLITAAKETGLTVKDYLILAGDTNSDSAASAKYQGLNGFEASLMELGLPVKDSYDEGISLRAASDTFQVYSGTRALFPEVVDSMLKWKSRMPMLENVEDIVAQSRTISGNEMITTTADDGDMANGTDNRRTSIIAELGQIPVRTIRTTESGVKFYKHGSGYQMSYEFNRRASLDILTPFASRVAREMQISRVKAATQIIINGDGVNAPAPITAITAVGGTAGNLTYKALCTWLIKQAEKGVVFDTVMGNVDMYIALNQLFTPTTGQSSEAEVLGSRGMPALQLPILAGAVKFVLSSSVPAGRIIGFTKGETLEELVEANSLINEAEKSIMNQSVTYVRTMTAGYKLAFADTRNILNTTA